MTDQAVVHRWYTRPVVFVTVCQVNHGECEIILCENEARSGTGRLFIELTAGGLADLRRVLAEHAVHTTETWWGHDSLKVDDPDGNELLFPYPG